MNKTNVPLPSYENPPVTEVALSVQFGPLQKMRAAHLGRLWSSFPADGFVRTEDHAPLEPVIESFDPGLYPQNFGIKLRSFDTPPVPRVWFLNRTGTELIQVQPDRFVQNWRKVDADAEYVRYPRVREQFSRSFDIFEGFVRTEELGEIIADQCEVTYTNHLPVGSGWDQQGHLDKVVTVWKSETSDDFLPTPEAASLAVRYIIPGADGAPAGRLYVDLQPAFRKPDFDPVLILTLTARGAPLGEGRAGIMKFFDLGREWIVRGFTSITTDEMHDIWRRTDVR